MCHEIVIYVESYIKQDRSSLINAAPGQEDQKGGLPSLPNRVPGLSDPLLPTEDLEDDLFSHSRSPFPHMPEPLPGGSADSDDSPDPVTPAPPKPSPRPKKDSLPPPPLEDPAEGLPVIPNIPSGDMALPLALKQVSAQEGDPVFIRIIKDKRLLELWVQPGGQGAFVPVKSYPVLGMSGTLGPKLKEGDKQAPEGFYTVRQSSLNPNSNYHLAFNIGYPNAWDRSLNRTGNYIMVHGKDVSVGCFAMGDPGIEELYGIVESYLNKAPQKNAVEVQIYPFIPTQTRILMEKKNPHHPFWCFLADAWVWTEKNRAPAPVTLEGDTLRLEDSSLTPDPAGRLNYTNGQMIRLQKHGAL